MEPDEGAAGGVEAVGRVRFRLSFALGVLQVVAAMAGVGATLLVGGQSGGTIKSEQQKKYADSRIAKAAAPDPGARSGKRISAAAGLSQAVVRPSGRPAPIYAGGATASPAAYGAHWPAGFAGYTVALASDIIKSDAVGAVAKARAAGLRHVGVFRSERYASLTPGYWFVFSGVYVTAEEARREVSAAVDAGFSDAYVRRVAE